MRVTVLQIISVAPRMVEIGGQKVEALTIWFSKEGGSGIALWLCLGSSSSRHELETLTGIPLDVHVLARGISEFREMSASSRTEISYCKSTSRYHLIGEVDIVDWQGDGIGIRTGDMLIPIDSGLLPRTAWGHLVEGSFVSFLIQELWLYR